MFELLTTLFTCTMAPKDTLIKGVQSRLRVESPEWSGFIQVYPISANTAPLALFLTKGRHKGTLLLGKIFS